MSAAPVTPMAAGALLQPAWPAPANVGACFTTRLGGTSSGAWASFNLAAHVGDDAIAVARNRALLGAALGDDIHACWLEQVHGNAVVRLACIPPPHAPPTRADAAITRVAGLACTVMVADCVPLLLCDDDGLEVAAVHAGWRGLANGIVARAVGRFRAPAARLRAWIGPCIGAEAYRVDTTLYERFLALDPGAAGCFTRIDDDWQFDLHALARRQLAATGVTAIHGEPCCVHRDTERFYSYRRDGVTGRMAALIWIRPATIAAPDDTAAAPGA